MFYHAGLAVVDTFLDKSPFAWNLTGQKFRNYAADAAPSSITSTPAMMSAMPVPFGA